MCIRDRYWDDVPLCPTLTRLTGLPCRLSNDAHCAALGLSLIHI